MTILLELTIVFRFNNVIQSGLFNLWTKMYLTKRFDKERIAFGNNDQEVQFLSLKHISAAFLIPLSFLMLSFVSLIIEFVINFAYK